MSDLEQRIAKLRELDKARTQGEWVLESYPMGEPKPAGIIANKTELVCAFKETPMQNARYLAAAPEMMRVIEEQDKQAKAMRETIQKLVEALRSCQFKEFGEQVFRDDLVTDAIELAKPWVGK